MKVTNVTPFLIDSGGNKSWLFVKLETDAGIVGWGEAYTQADRDRAMLAHIEEMGRHLMGRNPFAIKHFTSVMYLDYALRRPAMDFWSAQSALEQALWDVVGKACGQPVYNLLGAIGSGCTPMAGRSGRPHRTSTRAPQRTWWLAGSRRSNSTRSTTHGGRISVGRRRSWPSNGSKPCAKQWVRGLRFS
jgi:L-alanine-DL-glutamate epimerase-like enolase superfamily enzyme